MRTLLLLTFIMLTYSQTVLAQTFHGIVTDTVGKPLQGVSAMLKHGTSTVAFGISKRDGTFSATLPNGKNAERLELKKMGFATETIGLNDFANGEVIIMRPKAYVLKEVKVRPQQITQRGDTIDYLVNAFKRGQDRSIADVIARMPGLEVQSNGTITANGKPINKFYIEGMDLMGGKYAMASENLDASKVAKVQVLENHQPVTVLRNVSFSDQAALNIVLKDGAKNTWQGVADMAGGTRIQHGGKGLYDVKLTEMLFARRQQSISMYKADNVGKNIEHEIRVVSRDGETYIPTEQGLLSNIRAASGDQRSAFNNTHVAATNWLFKPRKDTDLRLQLSGLFDRSTVQTERHTTYTSVATGNTVTEQQQARAYRRELDGELMVKVNNDHIYLINSLKLHAEANNSLSSLCVNGTEESRWVRPHKRYIADRFRIIKTIGGGRSVSADGYLSYSYLPGTLSLHDNALEQLGLRTLQGSVGTSFRHKIASFHVSYRIGGNMKRQLLHTTNDLDTARDASTLAEIFLSPSISYQLPWLKLNAGIPLTLHFMKVNNLSRQHLAPTPHLFLSFEPSSDWTFSARYNVSWLPADLLTTSPSPIYTAYLSMRQGCGSPDYSLNHRLSTTVNYKDVAKGLFLTLDIAFTNSRNSRLYASTLMGTTYATKATDETAATYALTGNLRASKSFYWAGLTLRANAFASRQRYTMMVGGERNAMRSESLNGSIGFGIKPINWLSFDERSTLSLNKQRNRTLPDLSSSLIRIYSHNLSAYLLPGNWQIKLSADISHSNDETATTNAFFDTSAMYTTKRWDLELAMNNIFGNSRCARSFVTDYSEVYSVSWLRPREVILRWRFNF